MTATVTRWEPGTDVALPPWKMSDAGWRVYESLGPYTAGDADGGWVLAGLVDGMARGLLGQLDAIAPDPSVLLDPIRCPAWALAWLGQLVGVRVPADLQLDGADPDAVAAARLRIAAAPNWLRGTTVALRSVVAELLAVDGSVRIRERYNPANASADSPHDLEVSVRWSQLLPRWQIGTAGDPDSHDLHPEAKRRVLAALPAGIRGYVRVSDRRDWQEVKDGTAGGSTWQAVKTANGDWADVLTP